MLAWWLACADPDPDALLRAGRLDEAARALAIPPGSPADLDHPVAEILARRAATDPAVTAVDVARTVAAVRALEAVPRLGLRAVDMPFPSARALAAAAAHLGRGPTLLVFGRSETGADRDPLLGGDLPWSRGRLMGFATADLARLGAEVDHAAPARLVTVVAQDDTGSLFLTAERRPDGWWGHTSSHPTAAARWLLLADALDRGEDPGPAGAGLVHREDR